MEKVYFNRDEIRGQMNELIRQLALDDYKPDCILGIARGGLVPGVYLSHYFDVPFIPLRVPTNVCQWGTNTDTLAFFLEDKKTILIDDICDKGDTFVKLKQQLSSVPNLKFAVLHYNIGQDRFSPDYWAEEINKLEKNVWIVYPWEEWWRSKDIA